MFNQHCGYWWSGGLSLGPDSRNDLLVIGSDPILWSWSADRITQTPITIGSSDRENTKPNILLPIESLYKSFTGKFRIEITWLWLNEKRQTGDIYPWRHNGRCGDVIYECRFEKVMASSVHDHDHDPIEAGSFVESDRIEKSWADEKLVIRSLFHSDRIVSRIGPRASVATVLATHPCVSRCSGVNGAHTIVT